MPAAQEALEALGHPQGALPEPRLLADLFVRFQAQVPLRPSGPGPGPEDLLAAWLEDGAGCCGDARAAAFAALAAAAGFALEAGTARAGDGRARPVLLADGGRLLLDAGFPLPAPVRLDPPAEAETTGYGTLSVRPAAGEGADVLLETRGEERLLFRVTAGGPTPALAGAGEEPGGFLFRLLDDRLLCWRDGVLEISDSWSRLRLPIPGSDLDGLEALFGPPIPETLASSPAAGAAEAALAAYHASEEPPGRLLRLLSGPELHSGLLPEGWTVEGLSRRDDGFEWTLVGEGAFLRRERVTRRPDGIVVEAEGPLAIFRARIWRLETRPSGTRIRLLATLRDPVPPRGLPEGTRRRLVFELASELLALDRLAAGG